MIAALLACGPDSWPLLPAWASSGILLVHFERLATAYLQEGALHLGI